MAATFLPSDAAILIKVRAIERGVARAREEYDKDPSTFAFDITRQDAAVMNIQRACVAALECGQLIIRHECLGIPDSAANVFSLLAAAILITESLACSLQRLVHFRNVAIHRDETLHAAAIETVLCKSINDLLLFGHQLQTPLSVK